LALKKIEQRGFDIRLILERAGPEEVWEGDA
jgi:hypothetical protein